ncbi:uncharacterized protein LOC142340930 [Convolutriloba macropyga]|uniref:uncharacterized protein LOC142340930 n=1 Tax=Convolutriloba macropyga TaxID=536237 RepID=UPI003F5273EA
MVNRMEVRWYLLVVIAMQALAFVMAFFGHGYDVANTGEFHSGIWETCVDGGSCRKLKKEMFDSSDDWEKIKATRAMLILSHFAGLAVLVNLILAMLSILKAQKRVIAHSVTCIIQAFFLGLAVFLMTDLPLGSEMGWSQTMAWVAFVFACLVLPAGCTQVDENGKEVEEVNVD